MIPKIRRSILIQLGFLLVFILQLIAQWQGFDRLHLLTKPLLIPFLIIYLINRIGTDRTYGRLTVIALIFCWLGDVLLLFQDQNSIYFILGLTAFLIAHIFYIVIFSRTAGVQPRHVVGKAILSAVIVAWAIALLYQLWDGLGGLKLPVVIYAVAISLMGITSLFRNVGGRYWVITGAAFFILSDSLLAINKFGKPIWFAGIWIMSTYLLAQWLIVKGMVKFFKNE